ncbi:MAG: CheR family methyltransferase [bacterium]
MHSDMTEASKLSSELFCQVRDFLYQQSGLFIPQSQLILLEKSMVSRLQSRHLNSLKEYFYFLRFDKERERELQALYALIAGGEAAQFRNSDQLLCFIRWAVPEMLRRQQKKSKSNQLEPFLIWCAAGFENEIAQSLAAILAENHTLFPQNQQSIIYVTNIFEEQRIFGSLDPEVLRQSMMAFKPNSFIDRTLPTADSKMPLQEIRFRPLSLADFEQIHDIGPFDFIFFCYALMFFSIPEKQRIIKLIHEALKPGGYLFLGGNESLHGVTEAFELIHAPRAIIYQKEYDAWVDE